MSNMFCKTGDIYSLYTTFGMKKNTIILITGGSCSGKSAFASSFHHALHLSTDTFYVHKKNLVMESDGTYNFDDPKNVDLHECAAAVESLSRGEETIVPVYDMLTNDRNGTETIKPKADTKFIVVEGIFAFHSPLRELADIKIFIDTPAEIRVARRMIRDIERKGKSKVEILNDFIAAEKGYAKFIEPMKEFADLVIPHSFNPFMMD